MKRNLLLTCLFLGAFLLALSSCISGGTKGSPESLPPEGGGLEQLSLPLIHVDSEILLYEREQDNPHRPEPSPRVTLSLSLLDTAKQGDLEGLLNQLLYRGYKPASYAQGLIQSYKQQYGETSEDLRGIGGDASRALLNWYYTETTAVSEGRKGLWNILREKEFFTGGAHGMAEKQYYVVDPKAKKRLTLEEALGNLPKEEALKRAEAELRKKAGIPPQKPLSEAGYFEDTLTLPEDNFYLSPRGIGFHWDPYEIAPYSMGEVELEIGL